MSFVYVLLLGFAVSVDSFCAGVSYGIKNIRLPPKSLSVVGLVTVAATAATMGCAGLLGKYIPVQPAVIIGAVLLIILGAFSLFQEFLSQKTTVHDSGGNIPSPQLTFSFGKLVIQIMKKPETADIDHSQSISPVEALILGFALGIDNMVAVFAAGLIGDLPVYTPLLMGTIQTAFIAAGYFSGSNLISETWKRKFPFIPGAILIIIGLLRLG